jgi:hypothetical protein
VLSRRILRSPGLKRQFILNADESRIQVTVVCQIQPTNFRMPTNPLPKVQEILPPIDAAVQQVRMAVPWTACQLVKPGLFTRPVVSFQPPVRIGRK